MCSYGSTCAQQQVANILSKMHSVFPQTPSNRQLRQAYRGAGARRAHEVHPRCAACLLKRRPSEPVELRMSMSEK